MKLNKEKSIISYDYKPCAFLGVELAKENDADNCEGRGAGEVDRPLLLKT